MRAKRAMPKRRAYASARFQYAAADLVEFDGFEQGFEIALAEAFIALPLDELEEDRADRVLAEDLQQQALTLARRAVDQDAAFAELLDRLAMPRQAFVDEVEINFDGVLQFDMAFAQAIDNGVEIVGSER